MELHISDFAKAFSTYSWYYWLYGTSYGVVLLELITGKRALVYENKHIVSWVRSVSDDKTNKIDKIVVSYLAASFPNSAVLESQVTALLSLELRCT
ncbi:hypothetical protein Ahy_B10g104326 [Arachis hypogaea]|uniref:Serine-threonine/tyrosine-protein kinase catalytic domain-containing protein n=1 Tax=Arachis hypogaea TaxID=3818 RepID=A0A444X576_ARAHY|nr:hypothetical protein Ahy_B10g104326 [Arachis hypogaea]